MLNSYFYSSFILLVLVFSSYELILVIFFSMINLKATVELICVVLQQFRILVVLKIILIFYVRFRYRHPLSLSSLRIHICHTKLPDVDTELWYRTIQFLF